MNESAQHPPGTSLLGVTAWAMGIIAVQGSLWLAWFILVVRCWPGMEFILAKSDSLLPLLLQFFWTMCGYTTRYWYLAVLAGLPLSLLEFALIVAASRWKNPWLGAVRYAAIFVFALVPLSLILFAVVSLMLASMLIVNDVAPSIAVIGGV